MIQKDIINALMLLEEQTKRKTCKLDAFRARIKYNTVVEIRMNHNFLTWLSQKEKLALSSVQGKKKIVISVREH